MTTYNWTRFNAARQYESDAWLGRLANTIPTNFRLILCNGSLSSSSSNNDILTAEISGNGYTRNLVEFNTVPTLVGDLLTYTSDPVEFTPSGGSLIVNNMVLWADGIATPADAAGRPELIATASPAFTIGDGATYTFLVVWNRQGV
jgi:hypothetical protein